MKTSYPVQWISGIASWFHQFSSDYDPHTLVLTSFHGDGYRGNTAVLFESLCRHPVFQPVWLSRNPRLVEQLQKKFGADRACLIHSLKGIRTLNRASVIFLTHGTSDYPFMPLPRRAHVIQTYHGLPTKRGEYLRPGSDRPPGWLHRRILKYRFNPVDCFLSSSPLVTRLFSSRFNIEANRFVETGYPACDSLQKHALKAKTPEYKATKRKALENVCRHIKNPVEKLILYAPTFRRRSKTRWFPFEDVNYRQINAFLEENKAVIALRNHPNEKMDRQLFEKCPRFLPADQSVFENVNALLEVADAIITDYSSIYLEGLLLDIPVVFVPYDLNSYERGLALPYDEVTPGPVTLDQQRFLSSLKKAIDRKDGFEKERMRVRDLFFAKTDGGATSRVIDYLELILPTATQQVG